MLTNITSYFDSNNKNILSLIKEIENGVEVPKLQTERGDENVLFYLRDYFILLNNFYKENKDQNVICDISILDILLYSKILMLNGELPLFKEFILDQTLYFPNKIYLVKCSSYIDYERKRKNFRNKFSMNIKTKFNIERYNYLDYIKELGIEIEELENNLEKEKK